MYQALYRKWRPRDFDDVVGQEHITRTLKNEMVSGKLSHAYLFTGSRGTGKTTCSKIVAKAVNCLNPVDGNPCNICATCRGIDDGSILDVMEIDAASNNGVDNIRELREEAYFTPAIAKYRVYILDECHMLSPGAVNALLKILEEPPAHVVFVLATTEIHKVLPTILSRCQRFDFKRIKSRTIADRLLYVAGEEGFALEDDAAMLIARLSDGGMRDALSLLDLCASNDRGITVQTVTDAAGLSGRDQLFELADAFIGADPGGALTVLDALSENSADFSRLCEQMVGHYRGLMLLKTMKSPDDFIQATTEELERLRTQAQRVSLPHVLYVLDVLQETMGKLSRTAFKRTEFEMAAVRLCDKQLGQGLEALVQRLEAVELAVRRGGAQAPQVAAVAPQELPAYVQAGAVPASEPASQGHEREAQASSLKPEEPPTTPQGEAEVAPFADWAQVLAALVKSNGALYGAMVESKAYTRGDMVLIDCASELFLTLLRTSPAAKESLRAAILDVTGQKYNLGPYNPKKHTVAQTDASPLDSMLRRAQELGVSVEDSQ